MRLVDVAKKRSVNAIYFQIPQPMPIYYSTQEFLRNVCPELVGQTEGIKEKLAKRDIFLVNTFGQYHDFMIQKGIETTYNPMNRYIDLRHFSLWIKTVDEYVPDYAELDGTIHYHQNEKGQRYRTNGCYVRLYYLTPTTTRHVLYTSSGLHTVGITKWDITAAERSQFLQEKDERSGKSRDEIYQEWFNKLINRRRPNDKTMKLVNALMNPISEVFLDINKAIATVYPRIKQKDRSRILQSQAFRKALMDTLKAMNPSLKKAIQDKNTAEQVANWMFSMVEDTMEEGSFKEKKEALEFVIEQGYTETQYTSRVPLISDGQDMIKEPLQEADVSTEEKKEVQVELSDEEYEVRRQELNYPASHVMQEFESEDV